MIYILLSTACLKVTSYHFTHENLPTATSTSSLPDFVLLLFHNLLINPSRYQSGFSLEKRNHSVCSKHRVLTRGIRGLYQQSPAFSAPGTGFTEDNFSTDGGRGDGSGSNASDGEQWGATGSDGEQQMKLRSLAHPPLTSCCVARFLTGRGPVLVCGPGVGDPWVT